MIPLFSLNHNDNDYIRKLLRDNNQNLKLMAGADSIHDFFNTSRVPNDVFIYVTDNLIQNLHTLYSSSKTPVKFLKNEPIIFKDGKGINPSANVPYKSWLQDLSEDKITASDLEKKTEVYFENKCPQNLLGNVVKLTYRKVIDKINEIKNGETIENNKAVYKAYTQLCLTNDFADTIEIDMEPGEIWDTAYSTLDKTFIGLFLLNFFFPPPSLNQGSSNNLTPEETDTAFNTKNQTYMTFDAGSNIPTKIFGLLDQVINLVTPLNIADSASDYHHLVIETSQKRASVKNKYVFPFNTIPPNVQITTTPDKQVYLYNSNIYTISDGVNLYIEKPTGINIEYGEKNKYDFKVYASKFFSNNNNDNIDPCEILHFTNPDGTTYASGPGVKYLSNMISYAGSGEPPKPINSEIAPINFDCMNVFNKTNKPKALYYDLKRSGDWEQCIAALTVNKLMVSGNEAQKGRVILCTLDRLCALFSRSIGQNTIFHTGTKLHLYRYSVNLTPEEIARNNRIVAEAARLKQHADKAAAEEAAILLSKKQTAAIDIKEKITLIMSQLKQPFENYLTENIFIEKLKISNIANVNIYKMINFFARILFIKSLKKLNDAANNISDPQSYFDSLNEITDSLVTPLNYEPFIDNIGKYVKAFVDRIMLRGKLGDYDSEKLIELYSNLKSINKIINLHSKSIVKRNYKKKLEKEGVLSTLELILSNVEPTEDSQISSFLPPAPPSSSLSLPPAPPSSLSSLPPTPAPYFTQLENFVNKFKDEPYNNNSNVQLSDFTYSNKEYYEKLKSIINEYAASIPPTLNRGGAYENQCGGDLSDKERQEQENGYKSLMLELTNEFMSLSVSLNEITEFIAKNNTQTDWGKMNYKEFIIKMKNLQLNDPSQITGESSSAMEVVGEIDYTNKILEILEVFFENSWKLIEMAELNAIDTSAHKKLYYTIYTYFACLYGDINEDVNNSVVKDILADNYFLKRENTETRSSSDTPENKKKRKVEGSDNEPASNKKSKTESGPSKNTTVPNFLLEITFFNDYVNDDYYEYITTILNDVNSNLWFNNIISYCIKARFQENKRNNFALTVLTTLLNFFKYCIFYKVKGVTNGSDPDMLKLNNYGFNNGFLVLNDLKNGTTNFGKFFNKLITFTYRKNPSINIDYYEIMHQRIIFLQLPVILSILSKNFIDPDHIETQLTELNKISGGSGKYTRKKYKSKSKKMKTRKNKTQNKKLKRRKTQKHMRKRRPQKTRSNK